MSTIPVPRTTCDPIGLDVSIVALHTVVHVARRTARSRVVVRGERDGVDRWRTPLDAGSRLVDTRNCRLDGRYLRFDHALRTGQTYIFEYELSRLAVDHVEHELWSPAWDLVIQVRFHGSAVPSRCVGYRRVGGDEVAWDLVLVDGQSAHTVTLDACPGTHGIRWHW